MNDGKSFQDIQYESSNGVGELVVDRPEARNALRARTLRELRSALSTAEDEPDVTALIFRSTNDRVFCAGADLKFVRENLDDAVALEGFFSDLNDLFLEMGDSSLGIVGVVSGSALAGGLEVVLACDVVVASPDAEFGDQHINVNLMAAGGGSQRLPRILGPRRAKELVLTGKTITAETALDWGLVNDVDDDPVEAGRSVAERIASHHPRVVGHSKALLETGQDVPLEAGLELERKTAMAHIQSDLVRETLEEFASGE